MKGGELAHIYGGLYAYAGNNPVRYTDPDGKSLFGKIFAGACFVGAAVVIAAGTVVVATTAGTSAVIVAPVAAELAKDLVLTGSLALTVDSGVDLVKQHLEDNAQANTSSSVSDSNEDVQNDTDAEDSSTSQNQMQNQVNRGKAPKSVDRVDKGIGPYEQDHVHFKDKSALNKDGTWKHGGKELSNAEEEWLKNNGWGLPQGE